MYGHRQPIVNLGSPSLGAFAQREQEELPRLSFALHSLEETRNETLDRLNLVAKKLKPQPNSVVSFLV